MGRNLSVGAAPARRGGRRRRAALGPAGAAILVVIAAAGGAGGQTPDSPAPPDAPAKDERPAWNVDSPPGAPAAPDAAIDVSEGTWMNVDVSPDGGEVVFDLLGDLYTMPITGGEARALTSGVAWDMQPRYSPDGRRIAFTSDRTGADGKGGDNIWVVDRDGANPVQITKEPFRLLNSPCWTPDGEYIAARKHFTSRRSLGAGEIWLYHRSGGLEGLQLTTRPTEQKDVGEPAFSPDGRYLYYSLDATPGPAFEYSRDSGKGIYAIDRLDRVTGQTERYIAGPGGAIRPTPSPDGKSIAFVRRVRSRTGLFVQDLASGRARLLTDALERDMQETWAIHGVYPSIAWTPDSRSIVYWSQGKIRRIDAESGRSEVIPFRVAGTRAMARPLRFPVEVAPDRFEVKMLRSVAVSPRGDLVAYQALGHIYVRPLPDGEPRRLTTQTDHFEFFPSFSRDGERIVYATWSDEDLGSIRIAPASGGEGTVITREPGHYVDPVLSPDGSTVVFGRVSGGFLTTPLWGHDTGVYRMDAGGGPQTLVSKRGVRPQFGAESDRVYLYTVEEQKDADRRCLVSVRVAGEGEAAERTHLVSEAATEYRVSPDGRWVAFAERFNVYIAPLVATGREVSIGPRSRAVPVAKAAVDAGQNLQWSGDGRRLHWSLGPVLYTRDLADSFAFLAGAPESLPGPTGEGINISFHALQDRPRGSLALVGATVLTMRGDEAIRDAAVVIESNRVAAVGPRASTPVPSGVPVIDCAGLVVMPGLIDVHAHGPQAEHGVTPQRNWGRYADLAFGVTTVHDPSNDTQAIFAASELQRAGMVLQPRTFSTGTILYGAAGTARAEVESLDDARFHLRRMKAVGAFSVKSYNQPRRDQRQMVLAAARELGMMVVPEGGSLLQHNLTMVVDGHTGVEHSLPVERVYADVVQLWGATARGAPGGVGYTPTLVVGYGGIMGENYWYDRTNVWENDRLLAFVPRFVVDPRSRRRERAPDEDYNTLRSASIGRRLADAGVTVHLGAHGQMPGLGAHWELWLLAGARADGEGPAVTGDALTPMQALRAATIDGARYLGLDADLGTVEPGRLADLVVLERDPREDIRHSASIRYTVLNGRLYDSATMARLAEDGRTWEPRPRFFFEDLQGGLAGMRAFAGAGCAGCGIVGAGCEAAGPAEDGAYR